MAFTIKFVVALVSVRVVRWSKALCAMSSANPTTTSLTWTATTLTNGPAATLFRRDLLPHRHLHRQHRVDRDRVVEVPHS